MPRYYFHLRDDADGPDEAGCEFAGPEEARDHAIACAREAATEGILADGVLNLSHGIDVADESGRVLFTVPFGEAVRVIS